MEPVDVGVVYNRSELDIFTPPKELDPIHSTYDVSFLPITSLDNQGEVAFIINSSPDFTDFAQCTLTLVVQVTRADGSPIQSTIDYEMTEVNGKRQKGSAKSPEVSIPNAFLAALIRRMTVELNGVEIGAGSYSHFPQIMLLKTLLCHSDSYADNVLRHGMVWEKDLGSQFRSALDVGRFQFIKGSRELTLVVSSFSLLRLSLTLLYNSVGLLHLSQKADGHILTGRARGPTKCKVNRQQITSFF